jgi:hypothetical protein
LLLGAAALGAGLTTWQWRRRGVPLKAPNIRLPRAAPAAADSSIGLPVLRVTAEPVEQEDRDIAPPAWLIDSVSEEPGAAAVETSAEPAEPVEQAAVEGTADSTPSNLGIIIAEQPEPPTIENILAAQAVDLPTAQAEPAREAVQAEQPIVWSAEDRVLAAAAALAGIWDAEGVSSPVRGFDTARADGARTVRVNIDIHPDDESVILNLPRLLSARRSAWRASWRQDALSIEIAADGPPPPAEGPLIAPILDHGHGHKMTRFFPLATWRHLGIYGANALHALHALLSSLLYTQPPSNLALVILDQGEITPLYQGVPHLVTPPGDAHATLEALASALRRSATRAARPLALVMVEPDSTALARLHALLLRLRNQQTAPIHLITAQTQLHSAGREVYALLPALITAGGMGACSWLPGQGDWPRSGAARLAGRGIRVEGRPHVMDEGAVASALIRLQRGTAGELPQVLWDSPPLAQQTANNELGNDAATLTTRHTSAPLPVPQTEKGHAAETQTIDHSN